MRKEQRKTASSNIALPVLDWSNENKHEAFSEWVDFMSSYFIINKVEEKLKYNYILLSTGPKGRELLKNAQLTSEQKEVSTNIFTVFETHMIQKPNKWVERLEFSSMRQNEDTVDDYLVRLKTKADRCDFGNNKDERILEQIIKGLRSADERRNLIAKPDLTLKSAIESIRAYEITTKDNSRYKDANEGRNGVYHEVSTKNKPCTRCGKIHRKKKEDCYAFNKTCRRCNCLHHFEECCLTNIQGRRNLKDTSNRDKIRQDNSLHRAKKQTPQNGYKKQSFQKRKINTTSREDNESDQDDDLYLYTILRTTNVRKFSPT